MPPHALARCSALSVNRTLAPQVWSVIGVVNFLQALVDKSNIVAILEKARSLPPFPPHSPVPCRRLTFSLRSKCPLLRLRRVL